ncbi:porin family protein [Spirosoma migulaei]
MRRCLVLFFLMMPLVGKAQTLSNDKQQDLLGKGHISLGLSVGQGYRGTYPTTNFVSPRIQYFIANGWSIAAEGRFLTSTIYHQSDNKPDYRLLAGGLSTRYYFVRGKRVAVFAHIGTEYGQSAFHLTPDAPFSPGTISSTWQTDAGLGIQYRVGKRWAIEVMGGRSWLSNSLVSSSGFLPPADFNRWQCSVGINYRLH